MSDNVSSYRAKISWGAPISRVWAGSANSVSRRAWARGAAGSGKDEDGLEWVARMKHVAASSVATSSPATPMLRHAFLPCPEVMGAQYSRPWDASRGVQPAAVKASAPCAPRRRGPPDGV